jgi:hypothetical protein
MTAQILWGSLVLGACSLVHLVLIIWWVGYLKSRTNRLLHSTKFVKLFIPIAGTFALLIISHTIQVWIWAFVLIWLGALPALFEAIYFSLVTYTTLGYGDVILSDEYKVFGAMASVTGLLNFGVSTAILVAILGKILPSHLGDE